MLLLASTFFALAALPLSAQTQIEMTGEAGGRATEAEHRMEKVYVVLKAKISADQAKMLETAQQAWRRFRDDECTLRTSGSVGGSVHNMMRYDCLASLTNQRTADLEYQLNCKSGDGSCVNY